MNKTIIPFVLVIAVAGTAVAAELSDEPVRQGALQGPSSTRLAKPVTVTFGKHYAAKAKLSDANGKPKGESSAPDETIRRHALEVARRHFEDSSWAKDATAPKKAKKGKKKKGREIVIQSVTLVVNPGPSYRATVVIDRVQDGRRLGQATGQGFGMPDRTNERQAAAFAPGVLGLAMSHKANKARPSEDSGSIETAVLQALDSACLQLAAPWAGEQMMEDMQRKRR